MGRRLGTSCLVALACAALLAQAGKTSTVSLLMDNVLVTGEDVYMATTAALPVDAAHVVRFEPVADMSVVHHMLLYLCPTLPLVSQASGALGAGMHRRCAAGEMLAYGWGRNAAELALPAGVGFEVGGDGFRWAVLEVHYLRLPAAAAGRDSSGVILHLTRERLPLAAGLLAFASDFSIPAATPEYTVSTSCCYDGPQPLTVLAFRVHAHALGRLVYLERGREEAAAWAGARARGGGGGEENPALLLRRSPLLPQAFQSLAEAGASGGGGDENAAVPLPGPLVLRPGDMLRASCRYNASNTTRATPAGAGHDAEMCNIYVLFSAVAPAALGCYGGEASRAAAEIESGPVPPAPGPNERLAPHMAAPEWQPPPPPAAGGPGPTVSALALSPDAGRLWVAHSGGVELQAFDSAAAAAAAPRPPPSAASLALLEAGSGRLLGTFGAGSFSAPSALASDAWGRVWVADAGWHTLRQFGADGAPLALLGDSGRSGGGDTNRFCQPRALAVSSGGSLFVADGCGPGGARIAAFHPNGDARGEWRGSQGALAPAASRLLRPVALALDECADVLYVADGEGGRVLALGGALTAEPAAWRLRGAWDVLLPCGAPVALQRAPGGDVYALCAREGGGGGGGGGARLARLTGGRAAGGLQNQLDIPPAATWDVPGCAAPSSLALAAQPGGGPALLLHVGQRGGSVGLAAGNGSRALTSPARFALGEVGLGATRARVPGVGPGWAPAPGRATSRRVALTRAALAAAVGLLMYLAAAPASRSAGALGAGGEGGGWRGRRRGRGGPPAEAAESEQGHA